MDCERVDAKIIEREIIISQMTELQSGTTVTDEVLVRLKKIYDKTSELLGVIIQKKGKISKRLDAHERHLLRNNHFAY